MPSAAAAYDVVIAGASFAGLAVALQLQGRVLLLDARPIGEGQTSACGTTLGALRALDALHTVQQVHHQLVLHLAPARGPARLVRYPLPYAFCTFDYRALCQTLADRAAKRGVELRQARALGWQDGLLQTDKGPVRARCVVDATGWRAGVAGSIDPTYVRRDRLSCGLEAELPQPASHPAEGLHFWAGRGTVWPGYAWSFPCGPTARLGVIAYPTRQRPPDGAAPRFGSAARDDRPGATRPETAEARLHAATSKRLRRALDDFLAGPGADYWSPDGWQAWRPWGSGMPTFGTPTSGRHLHGGFLPCAPRRPVVGPVFVVGDAAGQCLGLTGEGIRPAVAFAIRCGQALQESIDGRLSPEGARREYRRYVDRRAPFLHLMHALQRVVGRMTDRGLTRYSLSATPGPVFRFLMGQYRWPADPAPLVRAHVVAEKRS